MVVSKTGVAPQNGSQRYDTPGGRVAGFTFLSLPPRGQLRRGGMAVKGSLNYQRFRTQQGEEIMMKTKQVSI